MLFIIALEDKHGENDNVARVTFHAFPGVMKQFVDRVVFSIFGMFLVSKGLTHMLSKGYINRRTRLSSQVWLLLHFPTSFG